MWLQAFLAFEQQVGCQQEDDGEVVRDSNGRLMYHCDDAAIDVLLCCTLIERHMYRKATKEEEKSRLTLDVSNLNAVKREVDNLEKLYFRGMDAATKAAFRDPANWRAIGERLAQAMYQARRWVVRGLD